MLFTLISLYILNRITFPNFRIIKKSWNESNQVSNEKRSTRTRNTPWRAAQRTVCF